MPPRSQHRSRLQLLGRKLASQKILQVMALLGVAWMIIFNYIPMYGLVIAFKEFSIIKSISEAPWVGLEHFKAFLDDENLVNVIRNTLGMSLLKLFIGFPLPIVFALMLNELRSERFKRTVQTISYLPHFLSWVILGGILTTWLADVGIINSLLMALHVIDEPISYLAEPSYFWGIVVSSDIWKELGWSAIIYLAAISAVSPELYEAATMDGAGRLQKMWYVTLPMIKGTITILFILAVSAILNSNFDQIFVLRNKLNESASSVIDIYVYQTGITMSRYSYATAVGLLKAVIAFFLLLTANYVTKKVNGTSLF
ncbi:sugar ABC transporter permease [Paenibacillus sp. YYML68]|uniref:ABC transporter permease n=1 Tax=Paenibacillus sp. YYML68 TaxID=2909250 RepID=UPI0024937994|nr:ABC transporter permease subunit [Paenibacillus sp. YYML68]